MTTSMDVVTPPRRVGAAAADPPPHPVPVPPADAPVAARSPIAVAHSRQSAVWLEAIKPKMRVNFRNFMRVGLRFKKYPEELADVPPPATAPPVQPPSPTRGYIAVQAAAAGRARAVMSLDINARAPARIPGGTSFDDYVALATRFVCGVDKVRPMQAEAMRRGDNKEEDKRRR